MEYITFKKSNCRNCHKCIRYCPVKSIRFSGNQANVISDECILCGECYVVCPQNAKQIADETEIVSVLLGSGAPVYASVAPSFTAYFNGIGIASIRAGRAAGPRRKGYRLRPGAASPRRPDGGAGAAVAERGRRVFAADFPCPAAAALLG